MSNVIKSFKDKKDGLRRYVAGVDTYAGPRETELIELGYLKATYTKGKFPEVVEPGERVKEIEYSKLTKSELIKLAADKGLEVNSKMTKDEIIQSIG